MRLYSIFTALLVSSTSCLRPALAKDIQEGDIVFQTSLSAQSRAIQLATQSPYSHMGMAFRMGDRWQVLEAVQPVKYTPLEQWIRRGKDAHFVVKRLKDRSMLTPEALLRMKQVGSSMLGKPYDLAFAWADDKVYCSELVWKIYDRALGIQLSPLKTLRAFNLSTPAVRQKMKERYGNHIPLEEPVVSPADIYSSPMLQTVDQKG